MTGKIIYKIIIHANKYRKQLFILVIRNECWWIEMCAHTYILKYISRLNSDKIKIQYYLGFT